DVPLAPAAAVGVCGVEGRDAHVTCGIHELERLLARIPLTEERGRGPDAAEVATAEDDARHADARLPQVGSLHVHDATRRPGCASPVLVVARRLRLPRR